MTETKYFVWAGVTGSEPTNFTKETEECKMREEVETLETSGSEFQQTR